MKKLFFILLIGIIGFLTPSTVAHAKGIDAPPATENTIDEIFFTYDEFTELFYYKKQNFYLKEEFKPYYDEILQERFLSRLYRVEGETVEHEYRGKTYEVPLYELGKFCLYASGLEGTYNEKTTIRSRYHTELRSSFAQALLRLDSKYDTFHTSYDVKGIHCYFFIMVHTYGEEFDEKEDIGIVIRYKTEAVLENFADYEYPTHDEYYEQFAGKPYQPAATSTPKPTNTPTPKPTKVPTPTPEPTKAPTPTPEPTKEPTPTPEPTKEPTPTPEPTKAPTPTPEPTKAPTPTPEPTKAPTPTLEPTKVPTVTPSPLENDTPDNNTTSTDAGFFTTRNIIIVSSAVIIIIVVVAFWVSKKKK